jgi:hypothetical protein
VRFLTGEPQTCRRYNVLGLPSDAAPSAIRNSDKAKLTEAS